MLKTCSIMSVTFIIIASMTLVVERSYSEDIKPCVKIKKACENIGVICSTNNTQEGDMLIKNIITELDTLSKTWSTVDKQRVHNLGVVALGVLEVTRIERDFNCKRPIDPDAWGEWIKGLPHEVRSKYLTSAQAVEEFSRKALDECEY